MNKIILQFCFVDFSDSRDSLHTDYCERPDPQRRLSKKTIVQGQKKQKNAINWLIPEITA